ncbi:hypothetical protein [Lichenibacterium ramalinae]|uniref:Uncharacterized protein n=1 Tax=Lichenibacterium ramalinae TaxID=2316527 RepID=A0A4Q2RG50_9HYPH|nr:hypothetical protein [Lichenibacterium ramalinae]RYB07177.1 hypothetical protein D3272_03700 [Lichenibacterium ramalinae]
MPHAWWIHVTLALATLGGWTLLLALPWLSGAAWPGIGLRGNVERATLFFLVAAVTRATITDHQTRWQITALASAALLLEAGRGWTTGRSGGLAGWLSSTAGVVVGAVLLRHVAHTYFWRWGW